MASIWLNEPTSPAARKLKGHLDLHAAEGLMQVMGSRMARKNKAEVVTNEKWLMIMRYDGNAYFSLWVEPGSPPSALETGQPKVTPSGGALLASDGTVHALNLPPKPPVPAQ